MRSNTTDDSKKTPPDEKSASLHTLTGRLTHMLHDLDPMGTCCRLNLDMEDEYASEAPHIARLLDSGVPLRDAVCQVFDEWFWDDCLQNRWGEAGLNALIEKLHQGLEHLSTRHDMPALHEMLFHHTLPDLSSDDPGWSYAAFMQTAPEKPDPNAFDNDNHQPTMPRPHESDPTNTLPWLHALLFEKTRRRVSPEHLLSYPRFLQQVQHQAGD